MFPSFINKTGLQPVSKPMEQEVGFLKDVKRGLALLLKCANTPQKSLVSKDM